MKEKLNLGLSSSLAILTVCLRMIPHPANFTPMGATAIFSGSKLPRPINYLLPIIIMYITDIFHGFHKTMIFVYGSFALTVYLSEHFGQKLTLSKAGGLALINSVMFFIITNFGVWLSTPLYPKTAAGLAQCYIMGIPFFGNMVASDVIFTVGIFVLYNILLTIVTRQRLSMKGVYYVR